MAVRTSGGLSAAAGADIEGDANDLVSELFIDPFSVLIDDQSRSRSFVFLVKVWTGAQIASGTGRCLVLAEKRVGETWCLCIFLCNLHDLRMKDIPSEIH